MDGQESDSLAMMTRLPLFAVVLMLAACAAAIPGYSPPPLTENTNKFAKPMESGDVGSDGRYHMSDSERAMDCKRLLGSMQIILARLKDAYGRQSPSAMSSTAQSIAPVFGGSSLGSDREAVYARERARLEAYNGELAARNCKTLDIEAELARPADTPTKY
jgi:hypothetical protein